MRGNRVLLTAMIGLTVAIGLLFEYGNTFQRWSNAHSETSTGGNSMQQCIQIDCTNLRIGLVNPTFTSAAYNNSFYVFYKKYEATRNNVRISNPDLHLLTARVFNKSGQQQIAVDYLSKHFRENNRFDNVTVLTDADVHDGKIFQQYSGSLGSRANSTKSNAYDVLLLFHNEYATQEEYDNIKTFVHDGGTLFVMDGNIFYAEVKYDASSKTITLLKGHWWQFDGTSATRGIQERWANETLDWIGGNTFACDCSVSFGDNPFGSTHYEEQAAGNPKDVIIKDYQAHIKGGLPTNDPKIATYQISYGQGKVVVMGLYTSNIITDGSFIEFFDSLFPSGVQ